MILYGITIVSSAFLLFLVQPIIAKQILPWFGGTAAVWTMCVVFFQSVLLAGYAYAHAATRRTPRFQSTVHVALLIASLATLPIVASARWKPVAQSDPSMRIVGLLAVTIGLPYFLLSSTGPLLQKWFAEDRGRTRVGFDVYRLFALSNAGSLVGLLVYPFAIEPYASLRGQAWGWSAGYLCFALACAGVAWRARSRTTAPVASSRVDAVAPPPTVGRYLYWLACAALGSMLLLAVTNHVTQNVASIPFLWVLPLTLYLLSFVVVFEGRAGRGWYVPHWWRAPVLGAVIAMAWALSARRGILNLYVALPVFSIGLFLACVFCHGEMAKTKPAPTYLTQFYLCMSAGGALGGLFVALVAPNLFTNYWETPLAFFGLCAIAALAVGERRVSGWLIGGVLGTIAAGAILLGGGSSSVEAAGTSSPGLDPNWLTAGTIAFAIVVFGVATWRRWPVAIVIAALLCTGVYGLRYYRFLSSDTLHASRNFYGALRVKETGTGSKRRRDLMHGVILHGDQFPGTDAHRRKPTTYYGANSGIALALREVRPDGAPIDVAMIGLGAGTLATWGRTGDRYRIYELNPAVVQIAHREFSYLSDSAATVELAMGDARLSMERELADGSALPFDVIAVDAFSSDSIPVHLITREALDVFVRHLKSDGIIAFHVSNRFLRLAPVVAQLADDAGLEAIDILDHSTDDDEATSEWVLVTRNEAFLDRDAVQKQTSEIEPIDGLPLWTDQFNNLFKILK